MQVSALSIPEFIGLCERAGRLACPAACEHLNAAAIALGHSDLKLAVVEMRAAGLLGDAAALAALS